MIDVSGWADVAGRPANIHFLLNFMARRQSNPL
jgi:hypothetical protein